MRSQDRRKLLARSPLRMLKLLPLAVILASCQIPAIQIAVPGNQEARTDPLACTEFRPLTYATEKPGMTVQDALQALQNPENPLGHLRAMLGDTLTTRAEIDVYMAGRAYLGCEAPPKP